MGTHRAEHVGNEPDPYGSIQQHRRLPSLLHTLHVGMTADQWVITDPETSMLVIAPPRSPGGKTRSVAVANVIMAAGPTVVSSTKTDIARNTAVAARRKGRLWEFNALESVQRGFTELRFSPVNLVTDKASALRVATDLMSVGDPESSSRGVGDATHRFFQQRSANLLAPLLWAAAEWDWPMERVVQLVDGTMIEEELEPIAGKLPADMRRLLGSVLYSDPRERAGVIVTAGLALAIYRYPEALGKTVKPNFNLRAFVRGDPDEINRNIGMGWHARTFEDDANGKLAQVDERWEYSLGTYDTLYVTASRENQALSAPLNVALINAIKREVYALARETASDRLKPYPITFVLDEMSGTAPIPGLPDDLADGGSQLLQILGIVQTPEQLRARYGQDRGDSLLTLFQNLLLLPGSRSKEFLELLSGILGEGFRSKPAGLGEKDTDTVERTSLFPNDSLAFGHPASPRIGLYFPHSTRPSWVHLSAYNDRPPWPQLLVHCAEHAFDEGWTDLPLPDLARGGSRDLAPWPGLPERWHDLCKRWAA